jgi:DMSO/TMAO reductase YedYZ molybdopterin-dependent catalytic subunit
MADMATEAASPLVEPPWLHGHAHEPNLTPPPGDGSFVVAISRSGGGLAEQVWQIADLRRLPHAQLDDCYIVSTGHGTSGPFRFGGALLADLLTAAGSADLRWRHVDLVSADGFGTRLTPDDLAGAVPRPPLLAYELNGAPLTRARGLVRLVVPTEIDDALRQVKWLTRIELVLCE